MTLQDPMELRFHVTVWGLMESKVHGDIAGPHGVLKTIMTLQGLVESGGSAGPYGTQETLPTL